MNDLDARAVIAVESLHADLAKWLGTAAPRSVYERFMLAQHARFSMVDATGEVVTRVQLAEALRSAGNAKPGLVIDVTDVTVLAHNGSLAVTRFTEVHHHSGSAHGRAVTAVLETDPAAPDGFRWLTVHETDSAVPC